MQKISFGNKEYVKASAVAKRFKYTQDYVGQLCRSKKVDARLVGRVWYVEPDSVADYRKTKHSTQKTTTTEKVTINQTPKRNPNPKPVSAVLRSKTLKSTQQAPAMRAEATKVQYSSDSEVSIPILGRSNDRQTLTVKSDSSKDDSPKAAAAKKPVQKIKIKKSGASKTNFRTEKLPEISLSGKLEVKDTSDEIELANQQKEAKELLKKSAAPKPSNSSNQISHGSLNRHFSSKITTTAVAHVPNTDSKSNKTTKGTFTPKRTQVSTVTTKRNFVHADWFLVSSLVLGVCSALVILSLASLGEVSPATNNSWSLFLNVDQLLNLLP